jgi:transcription elongation factor Elf1
MATKRHLWELFDWSLGPKKQKRDAPGQNELKTISFESALRQIVLADCPICNHEVAVFLTKTNRPFINCSFCSARLFYNGRESQRLLKKKMRIVEDE